MRGRILNVFRSIDEPASHRVQRLNCSYLGCECWERVCRGCCGCNLSHDPGIVISRVRENVIEQDVICNSEPAANGRLAASQQVSPNPCWSAGAIGDSETRRPIVPVGSSRSGYASRADRRVRSTEETGRNHGVFITNAEVQREILCGLEIILEKISLMPMARLECGFVNGLQKIGRSTVQEIAETAERPRTL